MRPLPCCLLALTAACAAPDALELDLDAELDPSWPTADGAPLPPPSMTLVVTPLREGQPMRIDVGGAPPGAQVRVGYSTAGEAADVCPPALGGACLGLAGPVSVVAQARADANGDRSFARIVPARPTLDVCFQAAVVVPGGPAELSNVVCRTVQPDGVAQPGPWESQDIWTTSFYSYAPGGGGPGGGLDNERLRIGGWGDTYHSLIRFDLDGLAPVASEAWLELYVDAATNAPGFTVDQVTSGWDWKTQGTGADRERLWWADHPSYVPFAGPQGPAPVGDWDRVDVTALYNGWQDGSVVNEGVVLRPGGTWNNFQEWASSETLLGNELRPRLVVVP